MFEGVAMINETKIKISDKMDPRVIAIVIIIAVIEFELFVYPKNIVMVADRDAWLSIVLGSIISNMGTWLLVKLAARFPQENLFQYQQRILGKYMAFFISLGYLLFWLVFLVMLLKDTVAANKLIFLPKTPFLVPLLFFAIGAFWLASYGLAAVIRFFQIMLPFLIIPLLPIYFLAFRIVEWDYFQPILSNGWVPVLKGAVLYAGAIQGLEIVLFLSPFLWDVKKALVPGLIGINTVNILALSHSVIAIGIIGADRIKQSLWPGIDTIQLISLPGFPVERFELFFTLPWITAVFTTICLITYLLSYGVLQVFHINWPRGIIMFMLLAAIFGTYLIPRYVVSLLMRDYFYIPTLTFIYLVPALTLLGAVFREKRGDS
jgi:spore germination protein (amino acid permease)